MGLRGARLAWPQAGILIFYFYQEEGEIVNPYFFRSRSRTRNRNFIRNGVKVKERFEYDYVYENEIGKKMHFFTLGNVEGFFGSDCNENIQRWGGFHGGTPWDFKKPFSVRPGALSVSFRDVLSDWLRGTSYLVFGVAKFGGYPF
jgi:hypothetical protein